MTWTNAIETAQQGTEQERRQAVEHIVAVHWKPLYKYVRFRYGSAPDDTRLLLTEFLEELLKPGAFDALREHRVPLREFLRTELDRYHLRWKGRPSGMISFPIDYASAEEEFSSEKHFSGLAADDYYEGEWVRTLFTLALGELQVALMAEGKADFFALFLQSDVRDTSGGDKLFFEDVARGLGIPVHEAMNALASTRKKFHDIIKEIVQSLTTNEEEYRHEMRVIFKKS